MAVARAVPALGHRDRAGGRLRDVAGPGAPDHGRDGRHGLAGAARHDGLDWRASWSSVVRKLFQEDLQPCVTGRVVHHLFYRQSDHIERSYQINL